jgi:hypothetical protein
MPPGKRTARNERSAPLTLERRTRPSRPAWSRGRRGGLAGRLVVLLDDAVPRVGGGGRLVVVEDAFPRIGVGWRRLVVPIHAGIVPDGAVRSNHRSDAANGSPRMRQEGLPRLRPPAIHHCRRRLRHLPLPREFSLRVEEVDLVGQLLRQRLHVVHGLYAAGDEVL